MYTPQHHTTGTIIIQIMPMYSWTSAIWLGLATDFKPGILKYGNKNKIMLKHLKFSGCQ
jgi:hypothetical protein